MCAPPGQMIRDWQTESGTFFEPDNVRAARSMAVLGRTVAQRLFADSDPVGQEIQIAAPRFKVTGVLAPKGQTASSSAESDRGPEIRVNADRSTSRFKTDTIQSAEDTPIVLRQCLRPAPKRTMPCK